eukprot:2306127-Lingulodinium_polyedra.AAC.1
MRLAERLNTTTELLSLLAQSVPGLPVQLITDLAKTIDDNTATLRAPDTPIVAELEKPPSPSRGNPVAFAA